MPNPNAIANLPPGSAPDRKGSTNDGAREWTRYRKSLKLALSSHSSGPHALRRIADKLVSLALDGDIRAIQEIGNRLDGLPKQQVEVHGQGTYVVLIPSADQTAQAWERQVEGETVAVQTPSPVSTGPQGQVRDTAQTSEPVSAPQSSVQQTPTGVLPESDVEE